MPARIILTNEQVENIKNEYLNGFGARIIAKKLNLSRHLVVKECRRLEIYDSCRKQLKLIYKEKKCKICNTLLPIDSFRKRMRGDKVSYETYCLMCEIEYQKTSNKKRYYSKWEERKQYRIVNKDKISKQNRAYRKINKEKLQIKSYINRKSRVKNYYFFLLI
jgi:hypothetical protein